MFFKFAAVALGALSITTQAFSNPGACSGTCTNTHDPSVIRRSSDGTYFRFSTSGLVQIHTASSISGPWTFACTMLTSDSTATVPGNAGSDLWAPDVSLIGSTYYVYYSVSTFGSQVSKIGLATSTTLECGSFTDHGATGIASSSGSAYNAIDPNLLIDGSTYRLQFGSFWDDIYQVTMASPPTKPSGTSVHLAYNSTGTHAEEGSFMIKHSNGYYYLFYSEGICCGYDTSRPATGAEYKVKVCRSTSPSSGFVDANGVSCLSGGGTLVLGSHDNVFGPGGQSVYNDPVNGWILVYHYVDTSIGYADSQKQFGWNKISFSSGWPVV